MNNGIASLGFGTAGITSMRSYGSVMRLLEAAYGMGITHFDTAPLYGQGYSEKLIGDFIRRRKIRPAIATKFGLGLPGPLWLRPSIALPLNYYRKLKRTAPVAAIPAGPVNPAPLSYRRISLDEVTNSLKGSLLRLRVSYIDYYLLHEALPSFLEPAAVDFLLSQKEKGVIRQLGVATDGYNLHQLTDADLHNWDVLQYEAGEFHAKLKERFPSKLHFLHSALKHISLSTPKAGVPACDQGGYLLARWAQTNHRGKIVFSTRREKVLKENLAAFKKYSI